MAPLRTTSTSALCLSGFLALDIHHLSDSTFGFGSEIPSNFVFWLSFLDVSPILCRPFPCDHLRSIKTAQKASMEQIADLYAMEQTAEATASTSRTTGTRNANGGLFA